LGFANVVLRGSLVDCEYSNWKKGKLALRLEQGEELDLPQRLIVIPNSEKMGIVPVITEEKKSKNFLVLQSRIFEADQPKNRLAHADGTISEATISVTPKDPTKVLSVYFEWKALEPGGTPAGIGEDDVRFLLHVSPQQEQAGNLILVNATAKLHVHAGKAKISADFMCWSRRHLKIEAK
jgi:hypothetical protein